VGSPTRNLMRQYNELFRLGMPAKTWTVRMGAG
jgi:hypothetical protein